MVITTRISLVGVVLVMLAMGGCYSSLNRVKSEVDASGVSATAAEACYFDTALIVRAQLRRGSAVQLVVLPDQLKDKPMFVGVATIGTQEVLCKPMGSDGYVQTLGFDVAHLLRMRGVEIRSVTDFLKNIEKVEEIVADLPINENAATPFEFLPVQYGDSLENRRLQTRCYRRDVVPQSEWCRK